MWTSGASVASSVFLETLSLTGKRGGARIEGLGRACGRHDRQVGQRGHEGRSARQVPAADLGLDAFGELTTATWSARFGVLRDDYTAKPAFATLQHVIMASVAAIT
jgi:hypothetical protein